MNKISNKSHEPIEPGKKTARTFAIFILIALGTGAGSWFFLAGLEYLTRARIEDPRWFLLGPVAGLLTGLVFFRWSPISAHGNSLLVALIKWPRDQEPSAVGLLAPVPRLMAPLIVIGTWLSHLAGLSVGREGTAIQMGGGIAATLGRLFGVECRHQQHLILSAGIAAGFGSIFGVPVAGAVFSLEILRPQRQTIARLWTGAGRLDLIYVSMVCLFASFGADDTAKWLGVHHLQYPRFQISACLSPRATVAIFLVAIAAGVLSWGFLFVLHQFKILWSRAVAYDWLRPAIGGLLFTPMFVAPLWLKQFAGLGTETILESLQSAMPWYEPLLKSLFTIFSIGTGFRGGEVTPLFFIGATAASAISGGLGLDPAAFSCLGLVAVFGAAAGVPLTCSMMAAELFGPQAFIAALPVCLLANWLCRHSRLYDREL